MNDWDNLGSIAASTFVCWCITFFAVFFRNYFGVFSWLFILISVLGSTIVTRWASREYETKWITYLFHVFTFGGCYIAFLVAV
jgi:hypothetical protein